jgi:hypothetical protein
MALSALVAAAIALAVLNVLLLGALGLVWAENYRQFRTPLVLGLLAFPLIMFLENAAAIYSFFEWGRLYADSTFAKRFVTGLRGLQFAALAVLTYATWQ